MRTVCQKIYKFNELSEEAKERAIEDFRNDDLYPWHSDNEETLKEFERIFPIKVKNWQYGMCGNSYINFELTCLDYEIEHFTGIRLMKWIYNNYKDTLYKGKHISTTGEWVNDKYTSKSKHSKIIKDTCCILTGYCLDEDILKPIYDFLKTPDNSTLYDIMNDCLQSWLIACVRDMENLNTDEAITETIEINEYEFDERGKLYFYIDEEKYYSDYLEDRVAEREMPIGTIY